MILLPFPDASVEAIYAGHLCEHLSLALMAQAILEWRRVLAPDGVLMVVGPDIDRAVEQDEPHWLLEQIIRHGDGPGGHAWTCSETVLRQLLEFAGWLVEPVPVAEVRPPEWPNPEPNARWQLALRCTLPR